jgi:hypothetical protein
MGAGLLAIAVGIQPDVASGPERGLFNIGPQARKGGDLRAAISRTHEGHMQGFAFLLDRARMERLSTLFN